MFRFNRRLSTLPSLHLHSLLTAVAMVILLSACAILPGANSGPVATRTPGPNFAQTAEALSTNIALNSSKVMTAQAQATINALTPVPVGVGQDGTQGTPVPGGSQVSIQLTPGFENLPSDVPVLQGEVADLFVSQNFISYVAQRTFDDAVNFYERQMATNGWTGNQRGSIKTQNSAYLNFEKDNRKASISIRFNPISSTTTIVITITSL